MTDPTIRRLRDIELRQWQRERERGRLAEEAEKHQQEMRHREQEATHRRRLSALEQEWKFFKLGMQQAQRQQQAGPALPAAIDWRDWQAYPAAAAAREPGIMVVEEGVRR
jgi:hypothetical protein